jgi:hypothetical protein
VELLMNYDNNNGGMKKIKKIKVRGARSPYAKRTESMSPRISPTGGGQVGGGGGIKPRP